MTSKRWDRRALEGLPLKLLIISLLLSLTAPAVLKCMDSYESTTSRSLVLAEARRIVTTIEEVQTAGEGNRRTITVTLPPERVQSSLALEIGGPLGNPSSMSVRCLCQGRVVSTLVLEDPPARVTAVGGSPLRLEAGYHHLTVSYEFKDGQSVITVAVTG